MSYIALSDTADSVTIPAYGMCAVIFNRSTGQVEVDFIENRSSNSVSFTTGAGDHLVMVYSRISTMDLSLVGLSIYATDNFNLILDDETSGNDTKASQIFIPDAYAPLEALHEKYSN